MVMLPSVRAHQRAASHLSTMILIALHAATNQRNNILKEKDFKVEQSSTAKTSRCSSSPGSASAAALSSS